MLTICEPLLILNCILYLKRAVNAAVPAEDCQGELPRGFQQLPVGFQAQGGG